METFLTNFKNCTFIGEFIAEREEILKHKWLESEKIGFDIGFNKALFNWTINHKADWIEYRKIMCAKNENIE